jgi:hypothetical protein
LGAGSGDVRGCFGEAFSSGGRGAFGQLCAGRVVQTNMSLLVLIRSGWQLQI